MAASRKPHFFLAEGEMTSAQHGALPEGAGVRALLVSDEQLDGQLDIPIGSPFIADQRAEPASGRDFAPTPSTVVALTSRRAHYASEIGIGVARAIKERGTFAGMSLEQITTRQRKDREAFASQCASAARQVAAERLVEQQYLDDLRPVPLEGTVMPRELPRLGLTDEEMERDRLGISLPPRVLTKGQFELRVQKALSFVNIDEKSLQTYLTQYEVGQPTPEDIADDADVEPERRASRERALDLIRASSPVAVGLLASPHDLWEREAVATVAYAKLASYRREVQEPRLVRWVKQSSAGRWLGQFAPMRAASLVIAKVMRVGQGAQLARVPEAKSAQSLQAMMQKIETSPEVAGTTLYRADPSTVLYRDTGPRAIEAPAVRRAIEPLARDTLG